MSKNGYDFESIDEESQILIKRWFAIRSLSKKTQKVYWIYFNQFLKYHDISVYNLYIQSLQEQERDVPVNSRLLSIKILDYKFMIDNSNYCESTRNLKMKVIFSFCKAFGLEYPKIRMRTSICEERNYERPITKKEILMMLNSSPLRERAFLSLQATTGMGSQEVRTLTLRDIYNCINKECDSDYYDLEEIFRNKDKILNHDMFELNIVRKKVQYRYITFTTSECLEMVIHYIGYRYNHNKSKLRICNDEDELIFVTNTGNPLNQKAVTAMFRVMGERVGFKSKENQYRFWRSHNVRKYFYNIVEDVVGSEYADEWLGHIPSSVTRAYARREYRMRNAYKKCLPYLYLGESYNKEDVIEKRLKILQSEIEELLNGK